MEHTIKVGLRGADYTLGLLQFVQNSLEVFGGIKQSTELPLVSFKVDRFPASGASDLCICLEPTDSLMELVTATRAGEIERGIS